MAADADLATEGLANVASATEDQAALAVSEALVVAVAADVEAGEKN